MPPIEPVIISERVKKGVRGAVKCADGLSPERYKSSHLGNSVISNPQGEEK